MMSANLRAFLAVIRWCEGTSDENGYRALYGHRKDRPFLFDGYADHPRRTFSTPWGWTSAAGAYQFMAVSPIAGGGSTKIDTWDRAKAALGLPDFSPESQDLAAIWLIKTDAKPAGALADIEAGRIESALTKCAGIWASLPGSPYGQPTRTIADCLRVFKAAGGHLATQAGAGPAPGTVPTPSVQGAQPPPPAPSYPGTGDEPFPAWPFPQGDPMPIPVLGSIAMSMVPELLKMLPMFGSGSKVSDRNIQVTQELGGKLFEAARAVLPEAPNEQAIVAELQRNPALQKQFAAQVALKWDEILPAFDKAVDLAIKGQVADDESRDKAAARAKSDSWDSMPYLMTRTERIMVLAIFLEAAALAAGFYFKISETYIGMLATLFVSTLTIVAAEWRRSREYRLGSSIGSKASGDAVRAIADQATKR